MFSPKSPTAEARRCTQVRWLRTKVVMSELGQNRRLPERYTEHKYQVALAMVGSFALGAVAVESLHAQAKPFGYVSSLERGLSSTEPTNVRDVMIKRRPPRAEAAPVILADVASRRNGRGLARCRGG
jgi:hypothetical protein